ncbi:MAG: SIMPL domain-containing protein [Candidatus Nanoarchaeia archaeon]|nr:SIMPL domain-containing protein [Candidatus Nanoarchaeia archaeon]
MKISMILGIFLACALVIVAGCQEKQEQTINVQGISELKFEPDKAEIWVGVSIVNDTAENAQNEVNRIMNAIVDGLRYKGIADKNMETEQISIYEERTWTEKDGSKVVGWRASQTLKVSTDDMTKIGSIVDVAVKNGANQIHSVNFGLTEESESEYKKQALADAAKNAKEKAETLAESMGFNLGGVKTVSEGSFNYYPQRYAIDMDMAAGAEAVKEVSAIVPPSTVDVTAYVNAVYYIK